MNVDPLEAAMLERFAVTRTSALRFGAWLSATDIPELTLDAVLAIADIADALEATPVVDPTRDADVAAVRHRYLEALLLIVFAAPLHHRVREQLDGLE